MLQWVVAVIAFDVGSNDSAPPIPTQTDSTAPSGPNVCNLMTQTVKASNSPFLPAGTLAKTDRTPPPLAISTRKAQHASRGPYKNTTGPALRRWRIFSVRFIRTYRSQNSLSASRSVQEAPTSLRNYCSNGMAICFHRLEDHRNHDSVICYRSAPNSSLSSLDKESVHKRMTTFPRSRPSWYPL